MLRSFKEPKDQGPFLCAYRVSYMDAEQWKAELRDRQFIVDRDANNVATLQSISRRYYINFESRRRHQEKHGHFEDVNTVGSAPFSIALGKWRYRYLAGATPAIDPSKEEISKRDAVQFESNRSLERDLYSDMIWEDSKPAQRHGERIPKDFNYKF